MHNLLVQLAGIVALATSVAHGVIGETKVFARAGIEPQRLRLLMRLVWQAGTVAWMSLAILLVAAPKLGAEARAWIIAMSIVTFGVAAVANAWATRGRHVGWVAMVVVVGLAAAGLSP
jgi:hypothetical protein